MTEEQKKAKELVDKFKPYCAGNSQTILNLRLAKKCAIIVVESILSELCSVWHNVQKESKIKFWNDVKSEIELL